MSSCSFQILKSLTTVVWPRYTLLYSNLKVIAVPVLATILHTAPLKKFTFIHLADAFIQSNLQLLYMSEVARLWSN